MEYIILVVCILNLVLSIYTLYLTTEIEEQKEEKKVMRKHTTVSQTNFSNILAGREYEKYKNEDGLYEPVKPKGGVKINESNR